MAEKNAPAKIWATPTRETFENPTWDRGEFYEDERHADGLGVQYVRADSHDKLVEALRLVAHSGKFQCFDDDAWDVVNAALASLDQESGQ